MLWIRLCRLLVLACASLAAGQNGLDAAHSSVTVRVFKSGFFSAFAHDHTISAPISEGSLNRDAPTIELRFHSADLKVVDKVSEQDRAEIEQTMKGEKVLDAAQFPEIRFVSTSVEPVQGDRWRVRGNLSLHGVTKPMDLDVAQRNQQYSGSVKLKQSEFGITPVKVAGGTVRVKDEIEILFEIVPVH
jgi:polyisoprenoid-binding protein YceI